MNHNEQEEDIEVEQIQGEGGLHLMLPIIDVFLIIMVMLIAQAAHSPEQLVAKLKNGSDSKTEPARETIILTLVDDLGTVEVGGRRLHIEDCFSGFSDRASSILLLLETDNRIGAATLVNALRRASEMKIECRVAAAAGT